MSLQIRRGTAAELANITPVAAELIYTTDTKAVFVGDGSTAGGIAIAGSNTYGNSNVAVYLPTYTGNLAGGNLAVTGNLAGGNLAVTGNLAGGNLAVTGNLAGGNLAVTGLISASGNVVIDSNNGAWTFDTTGNLNLPSDTTISTTTGNINLIPDGTGTVYIKGSANVLLSLNGLTSNSVNSMQINTQGNALGNVDNGNEQGGHYNGSYMRDSGPVIRGDVLAGIYGYGSNDGVSLWPTPPVGVVLAAANTWTVSNTATHISFYVCTGASNVPYRSAQFNSNGNLQIYNGGISAPQGNLFVNSGYFGGTAPSGVNALYAGLDGYTPLNSNVVVQYTSNANSYTQVNFQNLNSGSFASSDFVATANDGTDTQYFIDMGIASNNYSTIDYTAYGPHDGYLLTNGGNLLLNADTAGKEIKFIVGGTLTENVVATMSQTDFDVSGNIIATTIKTTAVIFSALPGAANVGAGARGFITDANTTTFGSQVTGGAANSVPVYSNGTNWYVG